MSETPDADPIVFSVVNRDYVDLARLWIRQTIRVSGNHPIMVCADRESLDALSLDGIECLKRFSDTTLSRTSRDQYPESTFPNDHASYTVSLKMPMVRYFLDQGRECLYSDLDAIWRSNPLPALRDLKFDIAFQPGSFPAEAKAAWGFAACTGFIAFRPHKSLANLLDAADRRFRRGDQAAFNDTLLLDCDTVWLSRPLEWEHCRADGWTAPIEGQCRAHDLRLLALPHVYFQRHNVTAETCETAIICHPNTPKIQKEKIAILTRLGLL